MFPLIQLILFLPLYLLIPFLPWDQFLMDRLHQFLLSFPFLLSDPFQSVLLHPLHLWVQFLLFHLWYPFHQSVPSAPWAPSDQSDPFPKDLLLLLFLFLLLLLLFLFHQLYL